jgi:hypothetical protein
MFYVANCECHYQAGYHQKKPLLLRWIQLKTFFLEDATRGGVTLNWVAFCKVFFTWEKNGIKVPFKGKVFTYPNFY